MPASARTIAGPYLVALLLFSGSLVVYAVLGASVFYKTDGPDLLRLLDSGQRHPWHVGYLPALGLFRDVLGWVGIEPTPMRLGTLFSATGMALGITFFFAGLRRLGVPRARREIATVLLAVNPAVVLFATVVEFHAPLMAVVGLAFWWTAVQVHRPTWWGMALLGAMTHLAFLMHSSAILLPGWLLPFFLARRWPQGQHRRDLLMAVVAGVVHTLLWFVLPRLVVAYGSDFYGWHADLSKAYEMETSIGRPQSLDYLPAILVQEWVWPLLPLSLTCLAAVARRALRLEFVAFAIGFCPYIYLCVRQLVFEPEHGAYMLPLLPAAALLTAQAMPGRRAILTLGLLVAASIFMITAVERLALGEDAEARYEQFDRELREAADGQPFVALLGRHDEMAMAMARLEPGDYQWLRTQATMPRSQYGPHVWASTAAGLAMWRGQGRELLLTRGGRDWLSNPADMRLQEKAALEFIPNEELSGPLFLRDLEQHFQLQAVPDGPRAQVFRLVPR